MGTFDIVFYTWGVYQPGTIFDHSLSQSEVPRDELIQVLKVRFSYAATLTLSLPLSLSLTLSLSFS